MAVTRKGVSEMISYVFVIAIIILGVSVVLSIGFPLIDSSTETAEFDTARKTLGAIDSKIREIASFGTGSRTEYSVSVRQGSYTYWPGQDILLYEIESTVQTVSSNTSIYFGNIHVTANGTDPTVITMKLNYSSINLTGVNQSVFSGFHRFSIENEGPLNGVPRVRVSLQ